jgi:trk system potassium uptake protein TrkA
MYIIIAGCRKVGSNLALELSQENHDVVVIDSDPNNFEPLGSGFNGMMITGMPIDEDILRSAGIERADALAAVTNDDNMNVMVSQMARELFHVPLVITRVYDPEREIVMNKMGLKTICATTLAVETIKDMLIPPEKLEQVDFNGTGVIFRTLKPGRRIVGKSIADIKDENILGVIKGGRFVIATPKTTIEAGDTLVVPEYSN